MPPSEYTAIVYIHMIDSKEAHVVLLASRTKVASIKHPRLELCGAYILTKLLEHVRLTLNVPVESTYTALGPIAPLSSTGWTATCTISRPTCILAINFHSYLIVSLPVNGNRFLENKTQQTAPQEACSHTNY